MKNINMSKVCGWFVVIMMAITMMIHYEAIIEVVGMWMFVLMLVTTMIGFVALLCSDEEEDC